MSKYALNKCWLCLCEVCTRMHCRKLNRRYSLDFCFSMMIRERCPVIKCDDFQHKEKHKVYRVVRRTRKKDTLLEKLGDVEKGIEQLLKKL